MTERILTAWLPNAIPEIGCSMFRFLMRYLRAYALHNKLTLHLTDNIMPFHNDALKLLDSFAIPERGGFCVQRRHTGMDSEADYVWDIGAVACVEQSPGDPEDMRVTWMSIDVAFFNEVGMQLGLLHERLTAERTRADEEQLARFAIPIESLAPELPKLPDPLVPLPPTTWERLG